jgi:thiamine biosynthesis protein ThiS
MHITINGEKKEISANITFAELLLGLGIDSRKIAVERNMNLVPRTKYAEATLHDGDEIEIINFVGGG